MSTKIDFYKNYKFNNNFFSEISNYVVNTEHSYNTIEFTGTSTENTPLPTSVKLVPLTDIDYAGLDLAVKSRELVNKVKEDYDLDCTVAAYYPPNGFIDWHTNDNVELYNAICTFSDEGNSFFEYEKDGKVYKIQDDIGWNVKITKWGELDSLNHRAVSNNNRITFTFSNKNFDKIVIFLNNFLII